MNDNDVVIVGGSGFIGLHLLRYLLEKRIFNRIIVIDIQAPGIADPRIIFIRADIANLITVDLSNYKIEYCIHLAALCKEPGYTWEEYFVSNYIGTKNICDLATRNKIRNIIFTSTMMVFKAGEKRNSENDLTAPDTAYGISKLLAEEVLIQWEKSHSGNKLKIIRPGVVFGKGEKGNFTRLFKALKKNLFVYVGRKDTIKGSVYVKDVVNMIVFLFNSSSKNVVYNCVFPEPDTIEKICTAMCDVMGWKRYIPVIPYRILLISSYVFEFFDAIGIKNPVHHRRIEKLYHSTHLSADTAINAGFRFSYTLRSALVDWKNDCGNNELF